MEKEKLAYERYSDVAKKALWLELYVMAGTQCVLKSCERLKGSQANKLLSATYAILTFGGMFMIEVDHLKNSCHYFREMISCLGVLPK